MVEKEEMRGEHNIDAPELNLKFYFFKKSETEDYEPSSIHNIRGAIERNLREHYYPHSITNDKELERTRQVIRSLKKKIGNWIAIFKLKVF